MKLSVIIACYNAEATLGEQLEALACQAWEHPWEVIVVNNRCTDRSMQVVEQFRTKIKNIKIVDALERQGQPFALNTGIASASGESVVLCDADDIVGEDYIKNIGDALQNHDFVVACIDMKRLNPFWGALAHTSHQQDDLPRLAYYPYLRHGGGGTLGFNKKVYETIGEFSEELPCLHDTDFCVRAQLAGYNLHFVKNAVMHVRLRDNYKKIYAQKKVWSAYRVLLAKMYRQLDVCTRWEIPLLLHAARVTALIKMLPLLRTREGRIQYIHHAAWFFGTVLGCFKYKSSPV